MRNLTLVFSNEAVQSSTNTRRILQRISSIGAIIGGALLFFVLGGLTAKLAFGSMREDAFTRLGRMDDVESRSERLRNQATAAQVDNAGGTANAAANNDGNRAASAILGATLVNLRGTIRCANTTQVGNHSTCSNLVFEEIGANGRTYTLENAELAADMMKKQVAIQGEVGANGNLSVTRIKAL